MEAYGRAQDNINESYQHIKQLTRLTQKTTRVEDFQGQQMLLSLSGKNAQEIELPCIMLPPAKNARVYDRDKFTDRIKAFFDGPRDLQPRSFVLYGIGGVGKSHVALKYALMRISSRTLDVALWLHSETDVSLSQSFTEAALHLGLPEARRDKTAENRILVLNWLQRTGRSPLFFHADSFMS